MGDGGRLVYSTDAGRTCPTCRQAVAACRCAAEPRREGKGGPVRVRLDTKKRRGKSVTLVEGLALPAAELAKLGKLLKRACGSGGTVKDGVIEIQGDHRERVIAELTGRGYRVR